MGAVTGPDPEFWRRIRVLVARQRIERCARDLLCDAEGSDPAQRLHEHVRTRLLLLAIGVCADRWWAAYVLARRAADAYAGTSAVLHGRRAFGDVPEVLVGEWEEVAAELEARVAARLRTAAARRRRAGPAGEQGADQGAAGVAGT